MARFRFTDTAVRGTEPPTHGNRIDYDTPGGPREPYVRGFALRTTAAGTRTFLLVYVTATGAERRHKIGDYPAHTVTTAREAARKLRVIVDGGGDPFADTKQARVEADAKRERDKATFGALLSAYVAQLRRAGKRSARQVERETTLTIKAAFPALWKSAAADVTLDDLARITGALVRAGTWRQAEKTRSYLRAAYTAASASRGDAATADLYADFQHVPNTARDLGAIHRPADKSAANGKRALSADELRAYWSRIRTMPAPHGALLRFHLLTGAQRCDQLARLTVADVDRDDDTMTLYDPKGRRKQPRVHVVPLVPDALTALDAMTGDASTHVFSVDRGAHGAVYHTVRDLVRTVALAMVDANEIAATFTPGELRITVETRLAAAGVSDATLARLQSHGLGGVQARHYNKHDYMDEKRAALEKLRRLLEPSTKVVPIRRKTSGASR